MKNVIEKTVTGTCTRLKPNLYVYVVLSLEKQWMGCCILLMLGSKSLCPVSSQKGTRQAGEGPKHDSPSHTHSNHH
jgi:hypothetical protein